MFAEKAAEWIERAAEKCKGKTLVQASSVLEQTAPEGERDRIIVWGTAIAFLADEVVRRQDIPPPDTYQAVDIIDGWTGYKGRGKGEVEGMMAATASALRLNDGTNV